VTLLCEATDYEIRSEQARRERQSVLDRLTPHYELSIAGLDSEFYPTWYPSEDDAIVAGALMLSRGTALSFTVVRVWTS